MADFLLSIPYVLKNEGERCDTPGDRGGKTAFGITAETAKRHGLDVDTLTLADAERIIRGDYWRFDGVKSQRIATKLLDMCVNFGLASGTIAAQRALLFLYPGSVKRDGIWGPKTEAAMNQADENRILDALVNESADRYISIVEGDWTQLKFLRGWFRRARRLP